MGISLSERIAKNQSKKNTTDTSKNKVSFLALKNDIAEALSAGWSMKAIWETLTDEKKIAFTYKTFRMYVSQYITDEMKARPQENTKEDEKAKEKAKGRNT